MTLVFVMFASLMTALSNYFIRRSVDLSGGGGDPFLAYRMSASGIIGFMIGYYLHGALGWDLKMILLGIISGCMLGTLMWLTGRTLRHGPPGLSFSIVNAACIAPPILMALLFGSTFGHTYTLLNASGALLVIGGILWASYPKQGITLSNAWYFWAFAAFAAHSIYLTSFQWRALTMKDGIPESFLIPFQCDPCTADVFTPVMFFTAALMQLLLPIGSKTLKLETKQAARWGWGGGLINGVAGFMTMLATESAQAAWEKVILFPLLCVSVIIFCNLWGKYFYGERIHWPANAVCLAGIALTAV